MSTHRTTRLTRELHADIKAQLQMEENCQRQRIEKGTAHPSHRFVEKGAARIQALTLALAGVSSALEALEALPAEART